MVRTSIREVASSIQRFDEKIKNRSRAAPRMQDKMTHSFAYGAKEWKAAAYTPRKGNDSHGTDGIKGLVDEQLIRRGLCSVRGHSRRGSRLAARRRDHLIQRIQRVGQRADLTDQPQLSRLPTGDDRAHIGGQLPGLAHERLQPLGRNV